MKTIKYLILFGAVFIQTGFIGAQSQWLDNEEGNSVSIEILKPFARRDSLGPSITPGYSELSTAIFITGRYKISRNIVLVGELPFANGKLVYDDESQEFPPENGAKIGNPYIGGEYYLPNSPMFFELGFRIPIVKLDPIAPTLVGIRADIDRSDAFLREIVPVYTAVNFKTVTESNILIKARVGGNIWFNTKAAGLYNQPEFSADYTLQTGYMHKDVNVVFGLTGNYAFDSGPKFPEKVTFLQYGLLITFPYKNIRPGFSIKVPGEEAKKLFNYVFGLNFTYGFK